MARKAAGAIAAAFVAIAIVTSSSSGQLLDDVDVDRDGIRLPGDVGIDLPGKDGGGGVRLPGDRDVRVPDTDEVLPGAEDLLPDGDSLVPGPSEPPPPDSGTDAGDTAGTTGRDGGGRRKGGRRADRDGDRARRDRAKRRAARHAIHEVPTRRPNGVPTRANPTLTIADFGPAPLGIPNFVIDRFTIPPFLLPIYQACGTQYGIPWQVLASINRIETAFGTNLNVSTAGAVGWMQFLPSTWAAYGVDANEDGRKDPYNPVDGICGAARYLRASGGQEDLRRAIFAYNHADWYVDEVLLYARQYGRLPDDLVASLTGLTEGARFPVAANARYADDVAEGLEGATRRGINVYTRRGAPAIAVNDGVVTEVGRSKRLGRYVVLRDAYGNRFTYARLGEVSDVHPVPRKGQDPDPDERATEPGADANSGKPPRRSGAGGPTNTEDIRPRLPALPGRSGSSAVLALREPSEQALERLGYESFRARHGALRFDRETMELEKLGEGSKVVAGTVLGRVGRDRQGKLAPHLHFGIQPAGRGAPKINPKPILDGWKLLEATHLYRAAGKDPFEASAATSGQVLLLSKEQATRELLRDPRVAIYECGRTDVRTGQIDSRVMRMLLYLSSRGFRLTVTSLKCGHSIYTASGNVSHHSTGSAVDIAQINGLPVLGNQGAGSITEALVRDVMALQGSMAPDQIISLMDLGKNAFAMGDHADHVHVGYAPAYEPGDGTERPQLAQILKADQWRRLIARLAEIENPRVPTKPSRFAVRAKGAGERRASPAHVGE